MSFTVLNLRGTSGSGKSTVVYDLMKKFKVKELSPKVAVRKQPCAYSIMIPRCPDLFVIGPYRTACGGCDGLPNTAMVMELVDLYAGEGNVLFEGLLMSGYYGAVGEWSEKYKNDFIFAFLNTPLDTCIERVQARRRARGDERPLNPAATVDKFKSGWGTYDRIVEMGRRVVVIDHRASTDQVLHLLTKGKHGKDNGRHLRPLP